MHDLSSLMIRLVTGPRGLLLTLAALLTVFLAACGRSDPLTATAPAGTQPATPRLVSTVPATTLQLLQIGALDTLVGVSTFDRDALPPDKRDLPVVGDYFNLNYEALLTLQPTAVVIQTADDRLAPRLKEITTANHIALVNVKLDTIADLYTTARRLGQVSGHAQGAETQILLVQAQLHAIEKRLAGLPRPKVVYLIGENPIFIVGGRRFMDEMITIAGGANLGATLAQDFPEITREALLRLAPDVILVAAPGHPPSRDPEHPLLKPWLSLPTPAAKSGRVYLVTQMNSQLNSFEIGTLTLSLAKLLHPEITTWDALPTTMPTATAPNPEGRP